MARFAYSNLKFMLCTLLDERAWASRWERARFTNSLPQRKPLLLLNCCRHLLDTQWRI